MINTSEAMDLRECSSLKMGLLDFEAGRSFLPSQSARLSLLSSNLLPISSKYEQQAELMSSISSKYTQQGISSKYDQHFTNLSPMSVSSAGLPPSDFSTAFDFTQSNKPSSSFGLDVGGQIQRANNAADFSRASAFSYNYQPVLARPPLTQPRSGRESALSSASLNNLEDIMEDTTVVYVSGAELEDGAARGRPHFGLQLCQGSCCPGRVKFARIVCEVPSRDRVGSMSSDGYSTPGSSGRDSVAPSSSGRDSVGVASSVGVAPRTEESWNGAYRKNNSTIIIPSAMPGIALKTPPKISDPVGFPSYSESKHSFLSPGSKAAACSLLEKSIIEDEQGISEKPANPNKWSKIRRKAKKGKK